MLPHEMAGGVARLQGHQIGLGREQAQRQTVLRGQFSRPESPFQGRACGPAPPQRPATGGIRRIVPLAHARGLPVRGQTHRRAGAFLACEIGEKRSQIRTVGGFGGGGAQRPCKRGGNDPRPGGAARQHGEQAPSAALNNPSGQGFLTISAFVSGSKARLAADGQKG